MRFKRKTVALTCLTIFMLFVVKQNIKTSDYGNKSNIDNEIETNYFTHNCDCKKDTRVEIRKNYKFSSIFLEKSNEDSKHLYYLSNEELEKSIFTCDFYISKG